MTTLFDDNLLLDERGGGMFQVPGQYGPGGDMPSQNMSGLGLQSAASGIEPNAIAQIAPGVGLAPPVAANPIAPSAAPMRRPQTALEAGMAGKTGMDKFMAVLGELGAGLQGKPSPIAAQGAHDQQMRANELQIQQASFTMFKQGLELMQKMPDGEQKDEFVKSLLPQMGVMAPAFQTMAKLPNAERAMVMKYAQSSPTLKGWLEMGIPYAVEQISKPEGLKHVLGEVSMSRARVVSLKVKSLITAAGELDPTVAAEIKERGGYVLDSDIESLNEAAKSKMPKVYMDDADFGAYSQNRDHLAIPGLVTPKKYQEILADKAKDVAPTANMKEAAVLFGEGTPAYKEALKKGLDKRTIVQVTQQVPTPVNSAGLTGEEFLKKLPADRQSLVKSVADGNTKLTSIGTRGGLRDAVAKEVTQYDPGWTEGKAVARSKLQSDFASGPTSRKISIINQAIGHIGVLDDLSAALQTDNVQVINSVVNKISNQLGKPEVNNQKLAAIAVGEELMRTFREAGASEREAAAWEAKFKDAQSPAQMKGAAQTAVKLLYSRINAENHRWNREFNVDTGYPQMFTPEAEDVLGKLGAKDRRAADQKPADALPAGIPPESKLIGKAPDGRSVYQSPDGKKWAH